MLLVKGILSFPNLFTPRSVNPGDDPKYSCTVLIAKNDPQLSVIQQAINVVKTNGFPSGFPATGKTPLHDCIVTSPENTRMHDYMELRCNAGADQKPAVVNIDRQLIIDPSQVYAGAEVYVSVNLYSYHKPVNKGVSAGLNGVMITGNEGALGRLDGRPTVDQMFAATNNAAPNFNHAPVSNSAPPPPVAPPPPLPAAGKKEMTAKANGATYESFIQNGWTDEMMIRDGYMFPSF